MACHVYTNEGINTPGLFVVGFLKIPFMEKHGPAGMGPEEKAMNALKGLEHLSYGDTLRHLGLFNQEKKRFQGDLRALHCT